MLDALPGKLGDVNHSVHAADVDECAVVGKRLDGAGILLTDLSLCPESFLSGLSLLLEDGTDGADSSSLVVVDLDDAELDVLSQKAVKRLAARCGCKRTGDENANAVGNSDNAALDNIGDNAFEDLIGLSRVSDIAPCLHSVITALGKHNGALCIVGLHDDKADLVAYLELLLRVSGRICAVLVHGDIAGMLSADVDLDLCGREAHDDTGDLLVVVHAVERLLKSLGEVLLVCFFGRHLLRRLCGSCALLELTGSRLSDIGLTLDCAFLKLFGLFVKNFGHVTKYLLYYARRG